jgi:hypothetical protein
MLCVSLGFASSNNETITVTDDKGNTYTNVDVFSHDQQLSVRHRICSQRHQRAATITATIRVAGTPTARTFASIQVDEFSGILSAAPSMAMR